MLGLFLLPLFLLLWREGGGLVGCGGVSEELCVCVFHGSGVNGVEAGV